MEVLDWTGLTPGSIPPFGSLFGLPTHCDGRLSENEIINFNAGDHAISIGMRYAGYQRSDSDQESAWSPWHQPIRTENEMKWLQPSPRASVLYAACVD